MGLKKRINIQYMLLTLLAIIATVAISSVVFYELIKKEVVGDLKSYTDLMVDSDAWKIVTDPDDNSMESALQNNNSHLRITFVDASGKALYDTNADVGYMENHRERPEIAKAFEDGSGEAIRKSETMGKSAFYYAVRLDNGCVLRVSKEVSSLTSVIAKAVPVMLVLCVNLFILCVILSNFLTKSIVGPIERLAGNLDASDSIKVYKELVPFVTTIRKQHEDIMRNANMRQEFTANVSHELKTPITSIKVLAESLNTQENVPFEVYQEFMQDIVSEIDRESKIIEDLLTLVRMDKTTASLNITSVNMNELLEMTLKRLKPIAQKKNIELLFESFRPVVAEIDEVKFTLVISNLVENAIKYNVSDGWVHVSLNADYQYFYVRVEDSGIGIPKESQDLVFDRFYRVDKARSRQTGGTGLGLAIVQNIVLLHHGTIKLHSEEGTGTTFTVRIPLNYVG